MIPLIPATAQVNAQALKTLSVALYEARTTLAAQDDDKKPFSGLIHHIMAAIIANADFRMNAIAPYPAYGYGSYGGSSKNHSVVLELIKHCFLFGEEALPLCTRVTRRIQPPTPAKTMDWFLNWFQPFVEDLQAYLKTRGQSLVAEPFSSCISGTVKLVIDSGVGKKPAEKYPKSTFSGFGCGCEHCKAIQAFLLDAKPTWSIGGLQKTRTRLERQLAARPFGLTWKTIRAGRANQLEVRDPTTLNRTHPDSDISR